VRCSVLQCVAVCCSVLQCVAVASPEHGALEDSGEPGSYRICGLLQFVRWEDLHSGVTHDAWVGVLTICFFYICDNNSWMCPSLIRIVFAAICSSCAERTRSCVCHTRVWHMTQILWAHELQKRRSQFLWAHELRCASCAVRVSHSSVTHDSFIWVFATWLIHMGNCDIIFSCAVVYCWCA